MGEGPFCKRVSSPTPPPPKTFIVVHCPTAQDQSAFIMKLAGRRRTPVLSHLPCHPTVLTIPKRLPRRLPLNACNHSASTPRKAHAARLRLGAMPRSSCRVHPGAAFVERHSRIALWQGLLLNLKGYSFCRSRLALGGRVPNGKPRQLRRILTQTDCVCIFLAGSATHHPCFTVKTL